MNKKLLSLAVAAAVAAPTAAMAEAILYGKIHQSLDYVDITNAYPPQSFGTGSTVLNLTPNPDGTFSADGVYGPDDTPWTATNLSVTADQIAQTPGFAVSDEGVVTFTVVPVDAKGYPIANNADGEPDPTVDGKDYSGWGVSARNWRNFTTVNPMTGIGGSVNDRANRLGVKGSEDLGNGLKAIYQVEFGLNMAAGSSVSYRNSFVGLAGNWGTALVGRHDTPLKISTGKLDLFSDTMADYNGTIGFHDVRAPTTVAYISPSFSGFSFAAASHTGGGGTGTGIENVENDSISAAYSLALIYSNGPFYGSAAYESMNKSMFMDSDTEIGGKQACINPDGSQSLTCDYVDNDFTKWRLGLGLLDWNGFTLTAIYEQQDDLPAGQQRMAFATVDPDGNANIFSANGIDSQRLWQVQAGYSFGNNMVKAMYGAVDRDAGRVFNATRDVLSVRSIKDDLEGDRSAWAIGFDHNFSKRTKVYALYTDVSDDLKDDLEIEGAEWSGFSLGLVHSF
jgi:predicted porin